MANDLAVRPLRVDTTMTGGAGLLRPIHVIKVYWFNPTTLADTFSIVDPVSSKVLLQGRAEVANQSQVFDFPEGTTWKDFKVIFAGGATPGTLYIYTK